MRRAILPFVALFALGLAGSACTVDREQPDLRGQDVRITFLHTSDIHSRIFPYRMVPNRFDREDGLLLANAPFGGLARIATLIKRERAAANRSLWLDSGDWLQGAPVFNLFKGEPEVRALSDIGLDGSVIGNHEFDLGATNAFEQIDNWAEYPVLCANYLWDDPANPSLRVLRDIVQPYIIYDLNGVKVGVIGMASWSSMVGIFEGGNSLGVRPRKDAEVVREYVKLLRPTVDVVVLLSHLGLDEDQGLGTSTEEDDGVDITSLEPLTGVDLILGGHLHIVLDPPKVMPTDELGHQAILVHSGAFAKYVGRLDAVVRVGENNADPEKRSYITAFSYTNIPVDSRIPDDPRITELLQPYSLELNREYDLDGVFAYVDLPSNDKLLRNDLSGGDSQIGNMVTRAMQERSGIEAEIAFTNTLGVRTDIYPGALDIEQMYNVFPFENTITVMYLSGSEIQESMDFVARKSADRGCKTQVQVSGLTFDMVCNGECDDHEGRPSTACAKNIYVGDNCRVGGNPDGPVDPQKCPPLLPEGLYRVATNDYIARGGSGFEVLKRNSSKQYTDISLRDALIDWMRRQPPCRDTVVDQSDPEGGLVVENWGEVACLTADIEPHDGRIRAVFE